MQSVEELEQIIQGDPESEEQDAPANAQVQQIDVSGRLYEEQNFKKIKKADLNGLRIPGVMDLLRKPLDWNSIESQIAEYNKAVDFLPYPIVEDARYTWWYSGRKEEVKDWDGMMDNYAEDKEEPAEFAQLFALHCKPTMSVFDQKRLRRLERNQASFCAHLFYHAEWMRTRQAGLVDFDPIEEALACQLNIKAVTNVSLPDPFYWFWLNWLGVGLGAQTGIWAVAKVQSKIAKHGMVKTSQFQLKQANHQVEWAHYLLVTDAKRAVKKTVKVAMPPKLIIEEIQIVGREDIPDIVQRVKPQEVAKPTPKEKKDSLKSARLRLQANTSKQHILDKILNLTVMEAQVLLSSHQNKYTLSEILAEAIKYTKAFRQAGQSSYIAVRDWTELRHEGTSFYREVPVAQYEQWLWLPLHLRPEPEVTTNQKIKDWDMRCIADALPRCYFPAHAPKSLVQYITRIARTNAFRMLQEFNADNGKTMKNFEKKYQRVIRIVMAVLIEDGLNYVKCTQRCQGTRFSTFVCKATNCCDHKEEAEGEHSYTGTMLFGEDHKMQFHYCPQICLDVLYPVFLYLAVHQTCHITAPEVFLTWCPDIDNYLDQHESTYAHWIDKMQAFESKLCKSNDISHPLQFKRRSGKHKIDNEKLQGSELVLVEKMRQLLPAALRSSYYEGLHIGDSSESHHNQSGTYILVKQNSSSQVVVVFNMSEQLEVAQANTFMNWKSLLQEKWPPKDSENDWRPTWVDGVFDNAQKVVNITLGKVRHTIKDIGSGNGMDSKSAFASLVVKAGQMLVAIAKQYTVVELQLENFWLSVENTWGLRFIQPMVFRRVDGYTLTPYQGYYLMCFTAHQRREFWALNERERSNRILIALLLRVVEHHVGVNFCLQDCNFRNREFGSPLQSKWLQYAKVHVHFYKEHPADNAANPSFQLPEFNRICYSAGVEDLKAVRVFVLKAQQAVQEIIQLKNQSGLSHFTEFVANHYAPILTLLPGVNLGRLDIVDIQSEEYVNQASVCNLKPVNERFKLMAQLLKEAYVPGNLSEVVTTAHLLTFAQFLIDEKKPLRYVYGHFMHQAHRKLNMALDPSVWLRGVEDYVAFVVASGLPEVDYAQHRFWFRENAHGYLLKNGYFCSSIDEEVYLNDLVTYLALIRDRTEMFTVTVEQLVDARDKPLYNINLLNARYTMVAIVKTGYNHSWGGTDTCRQVTVNGPIPVEISHEREKQLVLSTALCRPVVYVRAQMLKKLNDHKFKLQEYYKGPDKRSRSLLALYDSWNTFFKTTKNVHASLFTMRRLSFNTEHDQALPDLFKTANKPSRANNTYAKKIRLFTQTILEHRKQLQSEKGQLLEHERKFSLSGVIDPIHRQQQIKAADLMKNIIVRIPRVSGVHYTVQCRFSHDMLNYMIYSNLSMLHNTSYFAKDFLHTFGIWMQDRVGHKLLCILYMTSVLLNRAIDGYAHNYGVPNYLDRHATLHVLAHLGHYCLRVSDDTSDQNLQMGYTFFSYFQKSSGVITSSQVHSLWFFFELVLKSLGFNGELIGKVHGMVEELFMFYNAMWITRQGEDLRVYDDELRLDELGQWMEVLAWDREQELLKQGAEKKTKTENEIVRLEVSRKEELTESVLFELQQPVMEYPTCPSFLYGRAESGTQVPVVGPSHLVDTDERQDSKEGIRWKREAHLVSAFLESNPRVKEVEEETVSVKTQAAQVQERSESTVEAASSLVLGQAQDTTAGLFGQPVETAEESKGSSEVKADENMQEQDRDHDEETASRPVSPKTSAVQQPIASQNVPPSQQSVLKINENAS